MCVLSSFQTYGVNSLSQKAAAYAMNTQDEKVKARAKIFGERMKAVEKRLNAMKGVKCHPAEGAFYLFPDISGTGMTSEDFTWRLLNDAKVAVLPGNAFGSSGEGYLRIACTQSMEVLMMSMDRMEEFCRQGKNSFHYLDSSLCVPVTFRKILEVPQVMCKRICICHVVWLCHLRSLEFMTVPLIVNNVAY